MISLGVVLLLPDKRGHLSFHERRIVPHLCEVLADITGCLEGYVSGPYALPLTCSLNRSTFRADEIQILLYSELRLSTVSFTCVVDANVHPIELRVELFGFQTLHA